MDVDCSGYLDIEEFLEFMDSHYCFNEPVSDLWPIFRMLTPDGSKMVRIGKVREMFMKNSGNMNEFNEMVQSYADDTSIDFEEFVRLVTGIELAKKGRR